MALYSFESDKDTNYTNNIHFFLFQLLNSVKCTLYVCCNHNVFDIISASISPSDKSYQFSLKNRFKRGVDLYFFCFLLVIDVTNIL